MPKVKSTEHAIVAKLVEELGCDVLSGDGKILKYIACDQEMSYSRKTNIIAHLKTPRPRNNLQDGGIRAGNEVQKTVDVATFPIWKLENNFLKRLLEKYTGYVVPDKSTIRKNYVDVHYNNTMTRIRTNVGNSKLWVSIDKATGVTGRQIANMIIGTLEEREASKIYLLNAQ